MSPDDRPTRRRFVGVALGSLAALAGCTGGSDGSGDSTGGNPSPTDPTTTATPASASETTRSPTSATTAAPASTTTAGTDGLDLREANVTAVSVERDGGAYRFDVTLYHDDDGEDGYADWWQVETLAGDRLGRRELLHAHGTREFTRSETVEIPGGTGQVVVRGHDQTHGYGGQAMVVTLDTGETEAVRQGPEPLSFEDWSG